MSLAEAFARQGFGRPDAPSIDVTAVLAAISRVQAGNPAASAAIRELGASIGHAIVAIRAIVGPDLVLLGGPIGSQPAILAPARATVAHLSPGHVRIASASAGEAVSLQGALHLALDHGRKRMLTAPVGGPGRGDR